MSSDGLIDLSLDLKPLSGSVNLRRSVDLSSVLGKKKKKKKPKKQISLNNLGKADLIDTTNISPKSITNDQNQPKQSPKPAKLTKQKNLTSMVFNSVIFIALRDYKGNGPEELSFVKGEAIYFLEKDDNQWVRGSKADGSKGWFDKSYVKFVSGKVNSS